MKIALGLLSGPMYMSLGAACLVLNDAIVKTLTAELGTAQIILFRSLTIVAACCLLLRVRRRPVANPIHFTVLIRTAFTVGNVFVFVTALALLPFSIAVLLDYSNILFVALLAPLTLAEPLSPIRCIAAIAGFCGAFLVMTPELKHTGLIALLPVFSGLLGAGRELCTRRLKCSQFSAEELTLYAGSAMAIIAAPLAMFGWEAISAGALIKIMLAGVFQAAAMILMARALFKSESSVVAPFRLTALLWALLLGYFLFGDVISTTQYIGVVIIACALLMITQEIAGSPGHKNKSVSTP